MTAMTEMKPLISKQQSATSSSRILMDIPCKVCNDHSSGKHYGIYACDGCAGFFKRSIRRNRQYICKSQNSPGKLCTVDKTHRNQCRACRLTKCTDAGMNKDAVQHERGPRNSTIRRQMALYLRESSEIASSIGGLPYRPGMFSQNPANQYYGLPPVNPTALGLPNFGEGLPPIASPELLAATMTSMSAPTSFTDPLISSMIASRLAATTSLPQIHTVTSHFPKMMTSPQDLVSSYLCSPEAVCEAAARLLFMNVRWMKSIPAFLSLPYTDQIALMEEGWRELFVLGACQFQMPVDPVTLLNHAGLNSSEGENLKTSQIIADIKTLSELISKFKTMNIDPTEFACLKGVIIFKAALESMERHLSDQSTIVTLQDQAQLALSKYITSAYPNQPSRFGKLLLMLPALKSISANTIEQVFFRKSIGSIPMERLLNDMYKSPEM